jgi:hypothetical protein
MFSASSRDKLTVSDIVQNCTLSQQLTFRCLHISNTINVAADENILSSCSKVIQHSLILLDSYREMPMLIGNISIFRLSCYLRFSVYDVALNNLVSAFSFSTCCSLFLGEILKHKAARMTNNTIFFMGRL